MNASHVPLNLAARVLLWHTRMATVDVIPRARPEPSGLQLVQLALVEQQQLTAVEQFARQHADHAPAQDRYYSALLPATPPKPGEQYAFEVDLDLCSGCKACVTACHSLNGLDEDETWRDVGLLHGGTADEPFVQHVTTACHHCVEPACLSACPVNAYEKDPITGIVRHLDDQCFGCQYCTLACPYDVPKYNPRKGIVRKCDMCSQRLAVGEAPACVQSCPHQAISIRVVNRQQVVQDCEAGAFLPGAPDPQITQPTTNYKSSKPLPRNTLPTDYYAVRPGHSHPPLVVMLVLTQLSVGAYLVELLLRLQLGGSGALPPGVERLHGITALVFGLLALAASTLHLGRPQYAFRAVLGLGHSWLSREIVAFGLFAGLACADAVFPESGLFSWSVVASGALGVFCSVMIYHSTRRPFWHLTTAGLRFLLTTFVLGIATAMLTSMVAALWLDSLSAAEVMARYGALLCQALIATAAIKLVLDASIFAHLLSKHATPLKRTAMLMTGELLGPTGQRFVAGVFGGLILPAWLLSASSPTAGGSFGDGFLAAVVLGIFVATLAGELLERHLFFVAAVAPRMPGGLTT